MLPKIIPKNCNQIGKLLEKYSVFFVGKAGKKENSIYSEIRGTVPLLI